MKSIFTLFTVVFITLSMTAQPVITKNPQDQSPCLEDCAVFYVTAVGTGLNYQWYTDGMTMIGSNNDSLELCDSVVQYTGQDFWCVVTDVNGDSATSNTATLDVDSCVAPTAGFTFAFNGTEVCFTSTATGADDIFWIFGDGSTNSDNEEDPCHDYGTRELYYAKQIVYNDHGQDELEQAIDLLSIEEIDKGFDLFPNPTKDQINIVSSTRIDRIQLIDLQGALHIRYSVYGNTHAVDLTELPAGVYVLEMETEKGWIHRQVIKQ